MSSEKNRLGEPLSPKCLHLCVDMQRLFREKTDWHTPWMARVIPTVRKLVQQDPARTLFTRFMPLRRADEGKGTWRAYYERWSSMTIERLGESMIDVIPELAAFIPPACLVDKRVYSPWVETDLERRLEKLGIDTLVISGGETDVCVLADRPRRRRSGLPRAVGGRRTVQLKGRDPRRKHRPVQKALRAADRDRSDQDLAAGLADPFGSF